MQVKMKKIILIAVLLIFGFGFSQTKQTIFDVARNGDVELAKKMLKENKNVFNQRNIEGYSPLLLACYRGNFELAKLMIRNKADINVNSTMGTP